ncbi:MULTISPECIES: hypothetical protein [Okeania]|uniref:DHH family phosphoesterase n=1 Tax=Okeania TaxID=1458928 RepID=UPI0026D703E1
MVKTIPVVAVIDHHSLQENLKAEFVDIRPSIKATATILTQYIQAGLLEFDNNTIEHIKCATALMHGIRSDTNQLLQTTDEDFLATAYLSRFYDATLLNAVLQSSRSQRVIDIIERALSHRSIYI